MSSTVMTPAVEPNSSTTTARCRLRSSNSTSNSAKTLVSGTTSTVRMIRLTVICASRAAAECPGGRLTLNRIQRIRSRA